MLRERVLPLSLGGVTLIIHIVVFPPFNNLLDVMKTPRHANYP